VPRSTSDWWLTPEVMNRPIVIYKVLAVVAFVAAGLALIDRAWWAVLAMGLCAALAATARAGLKGHCEGFTHGAEWQTALHYEDDERKAAAHAERVAELLDARQEWLDHLATVATHGGHGFLYVIQFSIGTVKVGQSQDPHRRVASHRRDADAFGVQIARMWVSGPHVEFRDTEQSLIAHCAEHSTRSKKEYFHDLDFNLAVRIADSLAKAGVAR
jgi:hypothetical protein